MQGRRALTMFVGAGALALVAGTVQLAAFVPPAQAQGLEPFADCGELLAEQREALEATVTSDGVWGSALAWSAGGRVSFLAQGRALGMPQAATGDAEAMTAGSSPTGTNLQEAGVDEPDVAKLADGRIVVLDQGVLRVFSSGNAPQTLGSLRIAGGLLGGGLERMAFEGQAGSVIELLLLDGRAVVISSSQRQVGSSAPTDGPLGRSPLPVEGTPERDGAVPPPPPQDLLAVTRISLIDVSSGVPQLLEERVQDGRYVAARQTGDIVRIVTSSLPVVPVGAAQFGGPQGQDRLRENRQVARAATVEQILPRVTRFAPSGEVLESGEAVGCTDVSHADAEPTVDLLTVTSLRPTEGLEAANVESVTASGEQVYVAPDRIYVSTTQWPIQPMPAEVEAMTAEPLAAPSPADVSESTAVVTTIHAFDTSAGSQTRYIGSGEVPGALLNRWALSRHEGVLRAATTTEPAWSGADQPSESIVLTLAERDGRLVETGRLAGLGLTERITAVRYLGDLAAVVTFRQVDPLYLIDLSGSPRLLGELKIPGFSTYLHPIGDGLLLGIGYNADTNGFVTGIQASTFSISDPTTPRQVARIPITLSAGAGPGDSPALSDSRAFSYDAERGRALIPLTTWDDQNGRQINTVVAVNVNAAGGLSTVEVALDGTPSRVLLDDGVFHVLNSEGVLTASADNLQPLSRVDFPQ